MTTTQKFPLNSSSFGWQLFNAKQAGKTYLYKIEGCPLWCGNLADIRRDQSIARTCKSDKLPRVMWVAKIETVRNYLDSDRCLDDIEAQRKERHAARVAMVKEFEAVRASC